MSDIKCPICQSNLHKINIIVSTCTNDKCKLWGSSIPNLVLGALTQAKQDLERTRKALDLAITELKNFSEDKEFSIRTWQLSAKDKLEQITALEQKRI